MKQPIYLDYMATTPIDPRVLKKMLTCMTLDGHFANPASSHALGQAAEREVTQARQVIAAVIHGDPAGVIFTSGATESINLALKGAVHFYQRQGRHIITTQIEHKAVLDTCHYLSREGFSVTYLPVKANGLLDIQTLKEAVREDTLLVSIGHVNNEIGVIQDIRTIGNYLRERGILFHVDAAQSIGKVEVNVADMKVDLLSLSAHKAYGPKGVGALYLRQNPRLHLEPLMHGGRHERGFRSGTLPTHQIVGMAEAFHIAEMERTAETARLLTLCNQLWNGICRIPGIQINGDLSARVAGNLHLSFHQVEGEKGERLRTYLSEEAFKRLAISRAAACLVAIHEPSHVLKAIGLSNDEMMHCFRVSLGRFTTREEIDEVVHCIRSNYDFTNKGNV